MQASPDGIILLAKQSGISSFSSLWQVKNALGTKKIGHTGTLDTFAEGLLVALSGRLTRLAPYITGCDKEYEALVEFGVETDTLDPDGEAIKKAPLPGYADVMAAIGGFVGGIMQSPPSYSAVHVNGQRASERIRKGETLVLPPRPVTVYGITAMDARSLDGFPSMEDMPVHRLSLRVSCSKGTYIRSLARDIAAAVGSCAHLAALRRTRIGPFTLDRAAGNTLLAPFASVPPAKYGVGDRPTQVPPGEILGAVTGFSPEMSDVVGIQSLELDPKRRNGFLHGKKPELSWFTDIDLARDTDRAPIESRSVFCEKEFVGMVRVSGACVAYDFVAGDAP